MAIELHIVLDDLAWFETSPDAGDPYCICSYCGFVIPEDDVPFRLFQKPNPQEPGSKMLEARLHNACLKMLIKD